MRNMVLTFLLVAGPGLGVAEVGPAPAATTAPRAASPAPVPSPPMGSWVWPVVGPVIRGFDPPDSPYGSGHRGIDIAAPVGSVVLAAADGTVSFAGPVGGRLFVTIDHGGGWSSTDSFLSALLVRKGDVVVRGQPVALTGWGHTGAAVPHLHFGVRLDGDYVDPISVLAPPDLSEVIRLAPF